MKMTKTRIITALFGFSLALFVVPVASADSVISGSGTWDAGTQTTAYSQAGATWSFSFNLPEFISSNPTTQVTNFTYDLNGTPVINSLPGGVMFYSVADGGGFDLFAPLDTTTGATIISLYFPEDVGSNLALVFGTYGATIGINDGEITANGAGNVNITPEPPSILLLGTALMMASGMLYLRRRSPAASRCE